MCARTYPVLVVKCTEGGTRTRTDLSDPKDFKSFASTNSATPAMHRNVAHAVMLQSTAYFVQSLCHGQTFRYRNRRPKECIMKSTDAVAVNQGY